MRNQKKLRNYYSKVLKQLNKEIKLYVDEVDGLTETQIRSLNRKRDTAKKIDNILRELDGQEQMTIYEHIKEEAIDGYLKVFYDIEKQVEVGIDFNMLDERYVESLVNKSVKGKTFSKRLYDNRKQMGKAVTDELLQGAIDGAGYRKIARRIRDKTESNYKQALRIARTEGGRVQSETTQAGYEEVEDMGIEMKKQWVSSLDDSTREEHQELDGQIVGIDEEFEMDGYTAMGPRMFGEAHMDINCRCTTISIVDDIKPALRRDNVTKEVIKNQTYNEWKKNRVG